MVSCIKMSFGSKEKENNMIVSLDEQKTIIEDANIINQDNTYTESNLEINDYISGIYYVTSYEIISREGIYDINSILNVMEFEDVTEDNIVGNDKVFIEIKNVNHNSYLVNYNLSFTGSARADRNNFEFKLPLSENNLIYSLEAGMGGGGICLEIYLIDNYLFVKFLSEHTSFKIDEENQDLIPTSREEFICDFIFRKE